MARAAGCDSAELGSIPSLHTKNKVGIVHW